MKREMKARPLVLIVDRAPLDGRILEALIKPMASVMVRCNFWRTVELLENRGEDFDVFMIEDRLLDESTIVNYLPRQQSGGKVVALRASKHPVGVSRLRDCGATAILDKPYRLAELSRVLFG